MRARREDLVVYPNQAVVGEQMARLEELYFPSAIRARVGEIEDPQGTPQTTVMVAPKGPLSILPSGEAPDRARQRGVYTSVVPKGLLSLGGILGGGKS